MLVPGYLDFFRLPVAFSIRGIGIFSEFWENSESSTGATAGENRIFPSQKKSLSSVLEKLPIFDFDERFVRDSGQNQRDICRLLSEPVSHYSTISWKYVKYVRCQCFLVCLIAFCF